MEPGAVHRALRTGRESRGDEPGAADFYYGEMEMRRKSTSAGKGERWILHAYWLLSGYALRASRALAALVIVLVLSTSFVAAAGFEDPQPRQATLTGEIGDQSVELRLDEADQDPGGPEGVASASGRARWGDAVRASVESIVLRAPQELDQMTKPGRDVTTALRFFGPVLLALAALSVRGRVKR